MQTRDRRERKKAVLRRFAYVGSTQATAFERQAAARCENAWWSLVMSDPVGSRVLETLGAPLVAAVRAAAAPTDDPIVSELHRACAMYERPWPDIEGTPSREGSPHPLVVLALARILATRFWRGSRVQVDRDVTAWALWTYCQVPKTGRRGRSYRLDLGAGMTERVTPELIGLAAATDVLSVVAFAPRTIQRAIQRIGDFLDDVLRMTAPHGLVAPK